MNVEIYKKYKELIIGVVVGICAIAYLIGSTFIKRTTFVALGAEFMPEIYGFFMLFLSVCQIITGLKVSKKYNSYNKEENEKEDIKNDNKNVILTFSLIIGYVVAMNFLGFVISSMVFLFLLSILLTPASDEKSYKSYIAFSMTLPIITYYIFHNLMNIALPSGFLGF